MQCHSQKRSQPEQGQARGGAASGFGNDAGSKSHSVKQRMESQTKKEPHPAESMPRRFYWAVDSRTE